MLARKVKNGDLDFALVENYSGDDELEMRTLGYAFLEFCAPNKPPYNSVAQPVAINTLLRWPMLIYEWESGRHMVGNRHFRDRYGISLMDHYIVGEFDTHQAMVEGARNGMGWAAIPHCIAREYKDDPRILWFAVETDIVRYPVSLIRKKDRALSPLAQKFYSYIESDLPENYFAPSEG